MPSELMGLIDYDEVVPPYELPLTRHAAGKPRLVTPAPV